jgi:hypothetical protein
MAATRLHTGTAFGATARNSFSDPHSSASKCEKARYRSCCSGTILATASLTSGNMRRGPVWNSNGSSSTIRYWLKLNSPDPPGNTTGVLIR